MALKSEVFDKILVLIERNTDRDVVIALCNYYSTKQLEELLEFLEEEL